MNVNTFRTFISAKLRGEILKRIDLNGDGKISLLEFLPLFDDMMSRLEMLANAKAKFNELDVSPCFLLILIC